MTSIEDALMEAQGTDIAQSQETESNGHYTVDKQDLMLLLMLAQTLLLLQIATQNGNIR